jgi:hypothetical protein
MPSANRRLVRVHVPEESRFHFTVAQPAPAGAPSPAPAPTPPRALAPAPTDASAVVVVSERWLSRVLSERDRLEDENFRLMDRLRAMELHMLHTQRVSELRKEAHQEAVRKNKTIALGLRAEGLRLREVLARHELTQRELLVRRGGGRRSCCLRVSTSLF